MLSKGFPREFAGAGPCVNVSFGFSLPERLRIILTDGPQDRPNRFDQGGYFLPASACLCLHLARGGGSIPHEELNLFRTVAR